MSEKPNPPKGSTDTYLTVGEVAEMLRVSRRTIYRWMKNGKLNAFHPMGERSATRIPFSELNRFIEENTGAHNKEEK